jgi:N-acyl homoserine lactone hydrolase
MSVTRVGILVFSLFVAAAAAQTGAAVTITRLDCGQEPAPVSVASFSDTYSYPDLKLALTYSCYLIRHGDEYLLWDTGLALGSAPEAPKASLVELLGRLKLSPDRIKYVGISHYHYDHIGQLSSFPRATLLIGKGDWDVMSATRAPAGLDPREFASSREAFAETAELATASEARGASKPSYRRQESRPSVGKSDVRTGSCLPQAYLPTELGCSCR